MYKNSSVGLKILLICVLAMLSAPEQPLTYGDVKTSNEIEMNFC